MSHEKEKLLRGGPPVVLKSRIYEYHRTREKLLRIFLGFLFLFSASCLSGGCVLCKMFCPAPPPLLSDLNWATPEAAVDTYRKAFKANDSDYEFECLSDKLREKHGIGITEYTLGRDRFIGENRDLVDHLLQAEVERVWPIEGSDPPRVVVRLRKEEHHVDFLLVNEPVMWVKFLTVDGETVSLGVLLKSLSSVLHVEGKKLRIHDLPQASIQFPSPESIHEVRLTNRWRLLDIAGISASLDEYLNKSTN